MAAAAAAVDRDAANAVATPEAGLTVLIVGGGNAAHVLAAMCGDDSRERIVGRLLSTVGDEAERIKAGIDENGGIVANVHHDGSTIKGKLEIVSNDVEKCTTGADVIIFALPAFAHQPLLEKMAPFVKDGATIGAFPARGAFDSCVIDCLGLEKASRVTIFGLETLPWACRIKEYGKTVDILGTKRDVDVAVSPTGGADHACKRLQRIIGPLPTLTPVGNFLALTLMNGMCCSTDLLQQKLSVFAVMLVSQCAACVVMCSLLTWLRRAARAPSRTCMQCYPRQSRGTPQSCTERLRTGTARPNSTKLRCFTRVCRRKPRTKSLP